MRVHDLTMASFSPSVSPSPSPVYPSMSSPSPRAPSPSPSPPLRMDSAQVMKESTIEFLVASKQKYNCSICLSHMKDPAQLIGCLHAFCFHCIMKWVAKERACPLCRNHTTLQSVKRSAVVASFVLEEPIRCPLQHAGAKPCQWVGNLGNAQEHLDNECKNHGALCSHVGCTEVVRRHELAEHEMMCGFRMTKCRHCAGDCQFKDLHKHETQHCELRPFACQKGPKCSFQGVYRNAYRHINDDCPYGYVECPIPGCRYRLERQQVAQHIATGGRVFEMHSECMMRIQAKLDRRICELQTELGKRKYEQIQNQQSMEYLKVCTNVSDSLPDPSQMFHLQELKGSNMKLIPCENLNRNIYPNPY